MDKTWMKITDRSSKEYMRGVTSFIENAKNFVDGYSRSRCPCRVCQNAFWLHLSEIDSHLLRYGISPSYELWVFHGESASGAADVVVESNEHSSINEAGLDDEEEGEDLDDLLEDFEELRQMRNSGSVHIGSFIGKAGKKLYDGCKYSTLEFVVRLLQLKVLNGWSQKSFSSLLDLLHQTWADCTNFPKSYYDAKRMLYDFGLGYQTIHACRFDCTLYWGEKENDICCRVCREPKYKMINSKRVPNYKVLRYFPVTPRLQRLFMSRHTAKDMRWHKEKKGDTDGALRHPADGEAWKYFDERYPDFSNDSKNVRLGLASDGFNPYGSMSHSYSVWPVVIIPYNLPPWKCMKEPFRILSLLIPGPESPGKEIDVYLQPLIEELKTLWVTGVDTYDADSGGSFKLKAALLWTINDFPAYGNLSGWSTHGFMACPVCMDDTSSMRLIDKTSFTGARRYLPLTHKWRKCKLHDGKHEMRPAPEIKSGDDILEQLECVKDVIFGKHQSNPFKNRKRPPNELNWTKMSIFFQLPYWSKLKVRHMLDVMHIEKNVCEAILYTILNMDRSKDTDKAREDLKRMGIRKELHIYKDPNSGKMVKPHASYVLSPADKKCFLEFLSNIRFPDGYAANISRAVNVRNGKISGLKSHDFHVLLQRLLPIGLRPYLPKDICTTLIELSNFFRQLTSKTLFVDDLNKMEDDIVMILCKLERIFPPAFFDVMVHLCVHLVREAKLGGPVGLRWMYPIERNLGTYKRYVKNKARPEGSIAEAYVVGESLTFCSLYLSGIETKFNKPDRNDEMMDNDGIFSVFSQNFRTLGCRETTRMTKEDIDNAHWTVLLNCDEVKKFLSAHKEVLKAQHPTVVDDEQLLQMQKHTFPRWFEQHIKDMKYHQSPEVSKELYALACRPDDRVGIYAGCITNGVRFTTKARDDGKKTQNSGVVVDGTHGDDVMAFYGYLSQVLVLAYMDFQVLLFKCVWYNTDPKRKRIKTDYHLTSININQKWYEEDSFVLADQAQQVYYIDDPKLGSPWKVVEKVQHRHIWDVPEKDESEEPIVEDAYQQNDSSDIEWLVAPDVDTRQLARSDVEPIVVDAQAVKTNQSSTLTDDFICDELEEDVSDDYNSDEDDDNLQTNDDSDDDIEDQS